MTLSAFLLLSIKVAAQTASDTTKAIQKKYQAKAHPKLNHSVQKPLANQKKQRCVG